MNPKILQHTRLLISGLLFLLAITCTANCSAQIQWAPDTDSAMRVASSQNKLVLLHFEADWCRPCKSLDTFVFSDSEVQRAFAENVIPVRIDAEKEIALVERFGVKSLPFDIVLTTDGRVVTKRKSPSNSTEYKKMVSNLGRTINALNQGSPSLPQDLQDFENAVQQATPTSGSGTKQFDAQTASFTPDFPQAQSVRPSMQGSEMKRKVVQNPFVEAAQSSNGAAFQQRPQNQNQQTPNFPPSRQMTQAAQLPPPMKPPTQLKIPNPNAFIVPGEIVQPRTLEMAQQDPNQFLQKDENQFSLPNDFSNPPVPKQIVNEMATAPDANPQMTPPEITVASNPSTTWNSHSVPSHSAKANVLNLDSEKPSASNQFQAPVDQIVKSSPAQIQNEFHPQVAPQAPQVQTQFPNGTNREQPGFQSIEQSDVAAKLVREQARQKLAAFDAQPKRIMADKFYGQRSAKQDTNSMAGNYQAKIRIPQANNDFVPEPPQMGSANAQIVMNQSPPNSTAGFSNQSAAGPTPSMAVAASRSIVRANNPIERGLSEAAATPATSKFALHGKCPVALLTQSKWVDGNKEIGCVHRNRIYIFASQENLELFQSDPDTFSPILAGYDPVVYSETGRLVDGLEEYGVFMGKSPRQRIVLFASPETRARFQQEPRKYLENIRQAMIQSGGASSQLMR